MKRLLLFIVIALLCIMMSNNLWAQTPYAVYCEGDQSLHFLSSDETLIEGETLVDNNQPITLLWSGDDVTINGGWKYDWESESNIVPQNVMKVVFEDSFKDVRPKNCSGWFSGFWKLLEIENIENLNTSEVTDMSEMFDGCRYLQSLDVSHFMTDNVKDMNTMFTSCSYLSSLDVSHFNTANVENMAGMFANCSSLTTLDLCNFNTDKVTDMSCMFSFCSHLNSLDFSSFNTKNVTDMHQMFAGCRELQHIDFSSFDTEKVRDMGCMFEDCISLSSVNLENFYIDDDTYLNGMFLRCSSLKFITLGKDVKSMPYFYECYDIKKIISHTDEPIAFTTYCFENAVKANAKVYVPSGTKPLYVETDGWKEFVNFVANDLVPEDGKSLNFGIDGIDENTDLDGTIVNNIFFNISEGRGEYNPAESCITLNNVTTDEQMENITGLDLFDEYLFRNFTGMIFLLEAGCGTIEIESATTAGMHLNVKVGDAEPVVNTSSEKTTLSVPYTVAGPTYVYIYCSVNPEDVTENTNAAAKIYNIKLADASDVDSIMQENNTSNRIVYNLNGQRVSGSYRGVVIKGGKKIIRHQ